MAATATDVQTDVVLIGAGIMSATMGVLLKELDPSLVIEMFEVLEGPALESSDAWNNAGTGHAANMEFNYTPERKDGSIDISKALQINMEFDLSRQFWSYLVQSGVIADPQSFIHPCPHMGFVHGAENIPFLKKRHAALITHPSFYGMEYTEDKQKIKDWVPLVMEGRDPNEAVAVTRMISGADVDYGALTRHLVAHLTSLAGFQVHYLNEVINIKRDTDNAWIVEVKDKKSGDVKVVKTKYVYIGAGGESLLLLQKSNITEGKGYGGFPVSGIWLRCDDPTVNQQHHAKVYGQEPVGSPPMSAPHLDTRVINGKHSLLFGPYAGFSSKFLKHGSLFDLFRSINLSNVGPLMAVARDNFALLKYLIRQIFETSSQRFATLRQYYPQVNPAQWKLQVAGQRVQIIKPERERTGFLELGTEVVTSSDHTLIALLGASPGASTAVYIALSVVETCFQTLATDEASLAKLKKMIPSYGQTILDDASLCERIRRDTAAILHLETV